MFDFFSIPYYSFSTLFLMIIILYSRIQIRFNVFLLWLLYIFSPFIKIIWCLSLCLCVLWSYGYGYVIFFPRMLYNNCRYECKDKMIPTKKKRIWFDLISKYYFYYHSLVFFHMYVFFIDNQLSLRFWKNKWMNRMDNPITTIILTLEEY